MADHAGNVAVPKMKSNDKDGAPVKSALMSIDTDAAQRVIRMSTMTPVAIAINR